MSKKLKIGLLAATVAVGTFLAGLGSAQAQYYYVHHGWEHRRHMCMREGGIYEGHGVCSFPGRVGYRYYGPERERVYRNYNTNGYWSNGIWHYY